MIGVLLVKPLLIGAVFVSLLAYFRLFRSVLVDRLVAVGLFVSLSLLVMFPDTTTWFAHRIGVVRGTDLVLYLYMVGSLFLFICLYGKIAGSESRMTLLIREIALRDAVLPANRDQNDR